MLVQEEARGDLGLDGIEEVGEDGEELLERRLGASDLFVYFGCAGVGSCKRMGGCMANPRGYVATYVGTHLNLHLESELLGDGAGAEEVLDAHVAVRLQQCGCVQRERGQMNI